MTTASPLPGERPSRCLRFPNPLLPSLLSSRMPRAPNFHVGAQRSARNSGSAGNAIAEPSGWSGSSASRNFHHTSARLLPRTIADVDALLSEAPDPKRVADQREQANLEAPEGIPAGQKARLYYQRAQARSNLGQFPEAVRDALHALTIAKGSVDPLELGLFYALLSQNYALAGDLKKSLQISLDMENEFENSRAKGWLFQAYLLVVLRSSRLGQLDRAKTYVIKGESLIRARGPVFPNWVKAGRRK